MANTSSRTLRLLSLLQTHRYWPGAELAERLGVSVRTLRRDVDRLRELGYPVEAQRGVDGGYQLAAGAALPPLVVDDDEAVALAVGLQAAAQGAVVGIEEVVGARAGQGRAGDAAAAAPPGGGAARDDRAGAGTRRGAPPTVDPEVLTRGRQACRDAERLRFAYTAAGRRARTERHVEPHRLVPLGRRWYLVAYDLDRHDWRSFRLDRLDQPRGTGARFRPRELPAADAAAFVRAGIPVAPAGYDRRGASSQAPAAAVRERIGRWAACPGVGAGRCRVRMTADSLDWPVDRARRDRAPSSR